MQHTQAIKLTFMVVIFALLLHGSKGFHLARGTTKNLVNQNGLVCTSRLDCNTLRRLERRFNLKRSIRTTSIFRLELSQEEGDDKFDLDKFEAEMKYEMDKNSKAFAADLQNKLDDMAKKEAADLDLQVQFMKEDLENTKQLLTDEKRILNMGIESLKDFAEDIIMGRVKVYDKIGLDAGQVDLLSSTDAEDVKDMIWGAGSLTPSAKKAKADFLENVDEVLNRLKSAQNAQPDQAEKLNVEASIMIRQLLDQFKEVPQTGETVMFFDDINQAVWRKYLKETGYSAATQKDEKGRQEMFQSNLEQALKDQTAGYDALRASIKADIRKEMAPNLSKMAGIGEDEAESRFAADSDDNVDIKMTEPERVVAELERQMLMQFSTEEADQTNLGRTVVISGEDSAIGKKIIESIEDKGDVEVLSVEKLKELTRYDVSKDYQTVNTIICAANEAEKKPAFGFLPAGGKGGMNPENLEKLLKASSKLKTVVLLSTVGTLRADKSPFSMRNVLGDLDRQRSMEQAVQLLSETRGIDYTIIRTGKYISDSERKQALNLEPGDNFDGESTYQSVVDSVRQSLFHQPAAKNSTFSIESVAGSLSQQDDFDDLFLKLDGPEILRMPMKEKTVNAGWINNWSDLFLKPGSGLTTPVKISSIENGVRLEFIPSESGNFASFKEEKQAEKAKAKGKAVPTRTSASKEQGGLEIVAETTPYPRIRVRRCSYAPGAIVKEMSEATIVNRLKKDFDSFQG